MVSRKGLVVYYSTPKVINEIEKKGVHIVYNNQKHNYLTGYTDLNQFERIKKEISQMKAIKKVEDSLMDYDNYTFVE